MEPTRCAHCAARAAGHDPPLCPGALRRRKRARHLSSGVRTDFWPPVQWNGSHLGQNGLLDRRDSDLPSRPSVLALLPGRRCADHMLGQHADGCRPFQHPPLPAHPRLCCSEPQPAATQSAAGHYVDRRLVCGSRVWCLL
eukprot:6028706-Prymnesium_polylepis.1